MKAFNDLTPFLGADEIVEWSKALPFKFKRMQFFSIPPPSSVPCVCMYMQEMPEVPDVGILHCGELPHHKMGIKARLLK